MISPRSILRITVLTLISSVLISCGITHQTSHEKSDGIQQSFFENTFGDSYYKVKSKMRWKYDNYSNTPHLLEYLSMRFGGLDWDIVFLVFDSNNEFAKIVFEKSAKTEDAIGRWYDYVKSELELKYGPSRSITNGIGYLDNYDVMLSLRKEFGEAKSGEMRWYCHLEYLDLKRAIASSNEANPDF